MRGSRKSVIAWGVAFACVYLLSAFVSGRLSVLARRPLLDSFQPPPPYRFVKPPPDAATQEKPAEGTFSIDLKAPVLGAGVWATQDQQATLVTEPGTFPAASAGPVKLTIVPEDPAELGPAPKGMHFVGNAYRFSAASAAGAAVEPFTNPAHLVLSYPALTKQVFAAKHTLLASADGKAWRKVESSDSPANQQVSGDVTALGLFVAGEAGSASGGGVNPGVLIGAIAGGLAVVAALAQYFRVQRTARKRRARAKKGGKRPR